MRKIRSLVRWAPAVLIASIIGSVSGSALAAVPRYHPHPFSPRPRPVPPLIQTATGPRMPSSAGGYTIVDRGVPAIASDAVPVAFNDTGQILGSGIVPSTGAPDCILYNGSGTFLDVSRYGPTYGCEPLGLSAANAAGVVTFVGTAVSPFSAGPRAFYGKANRDAGSIQVLNAYANSVFYGVNSAGLAVGSGFYEPYGAYAQNGYTTTVVLVGNGPTPFPVDQCQAPPNGGYGCAYPVATAPCGEGDCALRAPSACGFGGCAINDAGTVVVADTDNGFYATDNSAPEEDTAISLEKTDFVLINDSGTLAYDLYADAAPPGPVSTVVGTTTVPPLPGNSCNEYYPLSLNNLGTLLGYTANCTAARDAVYFTWDPVHGTKSLNARIPANHFWAITPLGLNDNGQILISAYDSARLTHWALLQPPATAAAKRRPAVRS